MYIVDVIPLILIPRKQPQILSYFSSKPLSRGDLILVPLNDDSVKAVVITSVPLAKKKIFIRKSAASQLKNVKSLLAPRSVQDYQIKLAKELADYYSESLSLMLKNILPRFMLLKKYGKKLANALSSPPAANISGAQTLILMPEISEIDPVRKKLGGRKISLLHELTSNENRFKEWVKIANGEVEIIIGTEETLFAPFHNLEKVTAKEFDEDANSAFGQKYSIVALAKFIARFYNAEFIILPTKKKQKQPKLKQAKAPCYQQKFGHNFSHPGANCTQCGVNQYELNGLPKDKRIPDIFKPKKAFRGIHSEMHALAKDISEYCREPKKFSMYLGVIKNIGLSKTYQLFSELKQNKNIKTPGKLFLYKARYKENENSKNSKQNTK